jgi:hypothetical protein
MACEQCAILTATMLEWIGHASEEIEMCPNWQGDFQVTCIEITELVLPSRVVRGEPGEHFRWGPARLCTSTRPSPASLRAQIM